jgi:hypothetical protein
MSHAGKWKIAFPYDRRTPGFLRREHVQVCFNTNFSRRPDPILDSRINDFKRRFLSTPGAYDRSYFRLAGLNWENGYLHLRVGLATYLEYIAFRSIPKILRGISDATSGQDEYLPNVLGNAAILLTADGSTLCIVRSTNVRTYCGHADFPGGHPEPARIDPKGQLPAGSGIHYGELIRDELFDAVIREANEDLGTGSLKFDEPLLLAILLNVDDVMKPDMVFLIPTSHTEKEIRECFTSQEPKPHETAEVKSFDLMNPGNEMRGYPMTPVMEGALSIVHSFGHRGLERQLLEARKNN